MKKKRKSLRVASAALVCAMTATSVLPEPLQRRMRKQHQRHLRSKMIVPKTQMPMQSIHFHRK